MTHFFYNSNDPDEMREVDLINACQVVIDALQHLNRLNVTPEERIMFEDLVQDDIRDFKRLARKAKKDFFKSRELEEIFNSDN